MGKGLDRYKLREVTRGQATVVDCAQYAYRGHVTQCNGDGLSGRCKGRWQVFHTGLDRYAREEDLQPGTEHLPEFVEQTASGTHELIFTTRARAARFALLTY